MEIRVEGRIEPWVIRCWAVSGLRLHGVNTPRKNDFRFAKKGNKEQPGRKGVISFLNNHPPHKRGRKPQAK